MLAGTGPVISSVNPKAKLNFEIRWSNDSWSVDWPVGFDPKTTNLES